jgi:hypothetical protein
MSEQSGVLKLDELAEMTEESVIDDEKTKLEKARMVMLSVSPVGKWNILQTYLIEIQADGKLKEGLGQRFPTQKEQLELLKKKIESEWKNEQPTIDALLTCVPSQQMLSKWTKSKSWQDTLVDKMKVDGLFTAENRAGVIEAMRKKAADDGDVQAAKIWLTMSGDYTDKVDVSDAKFEKYKEYQNELTGKSTTTDEK